MDLKMMFLGCPTDRSHHGVKVSDIANANVDVARRVGFPP
jgi:hypothetical protein